MLMVPDALAWARSATRENLSSGVERSIKLRKFINVSFTALVQLCMNKHKPTYLCESI